MVAGPGAAACDRCIEILVEDMMEAGIEVKGVVPHVKVDLEALGFKPRFQSWTFFQRKNHCFHLSPFAEPFNSIYAKEIRDSVAATGFTIERADEIYGTDPIIEDIWRSINVASVITADVSGRNPNVMYEIGMAHAIGKPVVILTQTIEDVPFDLRHYRCIVYSPSDPGRDELAERLRGTLSKLKEDGGHAV